VLTLAIISTIKTLALHTRFHFFRAQRFKSCAMPRSRGARVQLPLQARGQFVPSCRANVSATARLSTNLSTFYRREAQACIHTYIHINVTVNPITKK
jgi:hypothetical protein